VQQLYCLGDAEFLLESSHLNLREDCIVDLAPSLNFLAICAAFVFVGAILLGAF
jgi:hypothetical protein